MSNLVCSIRSKQSLSAETSIAIEKQYPPLQTKEVIPSGEDQQIIPDNGYYGLSKVTVNKVSMQDKIIEPSKEEQVITADTGYSGLNSVTVNKVDSSIDTNIKPDNIKKGVSILGVDGTVESDFEIDSYYNFKYLNQNDYDIMIKHVKNIGLNAFERCEAENIYLIRDIYLKYNSNKSGMFQDCKMSTFTSNGFIITGNNNAFEKTSNMFKNCINLKEIDLSFAELPNNTSKYMDAQYMFDGCKALEKIINLQIPSIYVSYMFKNCNSLKEILFKQGSVLGWSATTSNITLDLSYSTLLDNESMSKMIDTLGKYTGTYTREFKLAQTTKDTLTEETIQKFKAKGYSIV